MNKKGAILKIALATMLSKARIEKKKTHTQEENERANTIQHHHHHQFGNQLTDSHLNEFQVHVRNRQNGCSCVNHLIHCTVMCGRSSLSLSLLLFSSSFGILFQCCCVLTPDDLICWR